MNENKSSYKAALGVGIGAGFLGVIGVIGGTAAGSTTGVASSLIGVAPGSIGSAAGGQVGQLAAQGASLLYFWLATPHHATQQHTLSVANVCLSVCACACYFLLAVLVKELVANAGQLLGKAVAEARGQGVVAGDAPVRRAEDDAAPGLLGLEVLGAADLDGDVAAVRALEPRDGLADEAVDELLVLLAAHDDAVAIDGGRGLPHEPPEHRLVARRVLHLCQDALLDVFLEGLEDDAALLHHVQALLLGVVGAGDAAVDLDLLLPLLEVGADLGLLGLDEAHLLHVVLLLRGLIELLGLLVRLALDEVDHALDLTVLAHGWRF